MIKRLKDLQFCLVLLAFLATVGVLFGGQKLVSKYRVEEPTQRALGAIKGIRNVEVKQVSDGLTVELKLDKVGNLKTLLDSIEQKVESYYNKPVRKFEISGQPDQQLQQIRYDLSFYLEEAFKSGHYIQLKEVLDSYQPAKARVYLGNDFIYIQLENDDHFLYEAIPRGSKVVSISNSQGGDSI